MEKESIAPQGAFGLFRWTYKKNESLIDAFSRVCQSEIDLAASINNAKFFGVYEHFYNDSFYGDEFSTHYVVLAYKILVDKNNIIPSFGKHNQYSWMNYSDLIKDDSVHDNTKAYFIK